MKVLGSAGGAIRLRLDETEAAVLAGLFTELAEVVETDALDADDPVRRRLYPDGYGGDAEASADFRELTESGLRAERGERARACAADIGSGGAVHLDAAAADRWIKALNDLRLALGTRLGVREEAGADLAVDEPETGDSGEPDAQEWLVYHWLTGLQDTLVRRLMV